MLADLIVPLVNQKLSVEPQPDSVVVAGLEGVRAGLPRQEEAGPTDAELVAADSRGPAAPPVDVDVGVDAGDLGLTREVLVVPNLGGQSAAAVDLYHGQRLGHRLGRCVVPRALGAVED